MRILKTLALSGVLCLAARSTVSSFDLTIRNDAMNSTAISINQLKLNDEPRNSLSTRYQDEDRNFSISPESIRAPEVISDDGGFILRGFSKKQLTIILISAIVLAIIVLIWLIQCFLRD